jgi:hypothetical protein
VLTELDREDVTTEKFAQNGGQVVAALGALIPIAMLVGWVLDPDQVALWVVPLAFLIAAVIWSSTVRPRVLVQGSSLVMRNMVTTVRIPLAAIEAIAVRQVMAVRAGDKRYVCAGVGRTLRQAMKGSAVQRAREQMGGLQAEMAAVAEPGMVYADYVELRVLELVKEDRVRRGLKAMSPEVEALAAEVRRELAWPEIAVLAVSGLLLVVAILV